MRMDDVACSCSQCNGVQRRRLPTAPIVNVLRDVASRIGERRPQPATLPEALLW